MVARVNRVNRPVRLTPMLWHAALVSPVTLVVLVEFTCYILPGPGRLGWLLKLRIVLQKVILVLLYVGARLFMSPGQWVRLVNIWLANISLGENMMRKLEFVANFDLLLRTGAS